MAATVLRPFVSVAICLRSGSSAKFAVSSGSLVRPKHPLFTFGSQISSPLHKRPFTGPSLVVCGRRSAKIAGRKGKADAVKAKLYGKIGKLIAQAVRAGGPDPIANQRLREVLGQAKAANLPVEIIERNLKKADDKSSADFIECVYEAYGVGGTGFIIEALTDNVNRAAAEVRSAVTKGGGKMADSGSVLFNFQRTGMVMVDASQSEDAAFEAAMDSGASDFEVARDDDGNLTGYKVLTSVEDYAAVATSLAEQGLHLNMEASGLIYVPLARAELDDAAYDANEAMMERLLAVDDVDAVFTNFTVD